ncbi:TonB-dependent receptor [Pseudomaricurvus alkylphenolicus]|uniref:TonB-dependent receptor n=1 Tax=Pseudomaricurvus alkylphenolicus TaxID=1306991 RepID=UPI001420FC1C|nr:TonB-dependent receptor [Pseudomaricurvus alkylphenolicus]NIB41735.1 TonB-dependent receptor [Pseudomaricurvus alkylphenolicus]
MGTHRQPKVGILSSTIAALTCLQVYAQASEPGLTLEEIVVVAERRESSLQETPIAISAFNAETLKDMGIKRISDVTGFAPNVNIETQPATSSGSSIVIRGITEGEPSLTVDPPTGVYLDGVYFARLVGNTFDVVDLERIEVLRGPQGTLYGRNTTAGAINLVPKKPSGELGFVQKITLGSHDRFRSSTTIDTPKVGDVSAKFTYMHYQQDGWIDNDTPNDLRINDNGDAGDFGERDESAWRLALRWEPNEKTLIDYAYDQSQMDNMPALFQTLVTDGTGPGPVFGPNATGVPNFGTGANDLGIADRVLLGVYAAAGNMPGAQLCSLDPACVSFVNAPNPAFGGLPPSAGILAQLQGQYGVAASSVTDADELSDGGIQAYAHNEQFDLSGHALNISYELSDNITLKSITSYRDFERDHRTEFGSANLDLRTLGGGVLTLFAGGQRGVTGSKGEQFSQELQVIGEFDRWRYVAGAYYFQEENQETSQEQTPFSFGVFESPRGYTADNSAWALYAQGSFTPKILDEKLEVTLGLRYSEDSREMSITETPLGSTTPISADFEEDFDNVSGTLILNYAVTDQTSVYASVSTGYKTGGYLSRTSIANQRPYDEETLINYEFGWKSQLWDNRVRLNGAVFHSLYEDKQLSQFVPTTSGAETIISNAGEAEYTGVEMELTVLLTQGLTTHLSYGYLDAQYNQYTFFDPTGQFCGSPGTVCDVRDRGNFPWTSKHTGSASLAYEFEPFGFGSLSARIDASYRSNYTPGTIEGRFDEFVETGDVTLVNGRLSLKDIPLSRGAMELSIWGRNLTDKVYPANAISAFEAVGFAGSVMNQERSWGLDFIYTY